MSIFGRFFGVWMSNVLDLVVVQWLLYILLLCLSKQEVELCTRPKTYPFPKPPNASSIWERVVTTWLRRVAVVPSHTVSIHSTTNHVAAPMSPSLPLPRPQQIVFPRPLDDIACMEDAINWLVSNGVMGEVSTGEDCSVLAPPPLLPSRCPRVYLFFLNRILLFRRTTQMHFWCSAETWLRDLAACGKISTLVVAAQVCVIYVWYFSRLSSVVHARQCYRLIVAIARS